MKTSKHWASEGGAQLCQEGKWHNFPRFKALLRLSERLVLSMFADQPESKHGCLSLSLLTLMPQLCSWTASQICAITGSSLWFIFCVCIFSHLVDAHGSNLPVSILTVFSICCLLFFAQERRMEIWTGILIHLICLSGLKQQKVMLMFVLLEMTSSLGAGGS